MMDDMDSINRERKKEQLRRQMFHSQGYVQNADREEDRERSKEVDRARRRAAQHLVAAAAAIIILMGIVGVCLQRYQQFFEFSEYKVSWEIPMNEGSYVGYEYFGTNMLRYTKDGASYIDIHGNTVWTQSYEMLAPIVSSMNGYAAIADQRGNSIYIFDESGVQGVASTLLPISKVTVAGNGVVAAVQEEAAASYITFFSRDGSTLVSIKARMGGNGYPLDISLSGDGTQLISSYMYLQNGQAKGRVVFYDFSEIGKNVPTRLVAGFDENFEGSIVAEVCFLSEPYSCAFASDRLAFFSTKNLASPELIKEIPSEDRIQSVFYSDEYAGMIVSTSNIETPYRMELYRNTGELVLRKEFQYPYQYVDIDKDLVFLYNEDSCRIYNLSGVLKLAAEFDFRVTKIRKGRLTNTLIVAGPQDMKELKMQ